MAIQSNSLNETTTDRCNVSDSVGIFPDSDGSFMVLTGTRSRSYKTLAGASRGLRRMAPGIADRLGIK